MTKLYTKGSTVTDEVLSGAERYDIKEDAGTAYKTNMQVVLATPVAVAGTVIDAARINNMEDGIDALDDILSIAREVLTAARTYYVRTDGNDSNTGLVNNSGGAFLTLQKAINVASGNLDIGIYDVTIQLAAGTYSTSVGNVLKTCVGSGKVIIIGDETTPANVVIHCTSTPALFLYEQAGTTYSLRGLKLTSTGSAGYGMRIRYGAALTFQNLNFGSLAGAQAIRADDNGIIEVTGNYEISGGCGFHILLNAGGRLRCQSKTITITGTPAWSSYFLGASFTATVAINGNTYSGSATGARYLVETNAIVYTAGGATYFPGNASGSTATGGQYL